MVKVIVKLGAVVILLASLAGCDVGAEWSTGPQHGAFSAEAAASNPSVSNRAGAQSAVRLAIKFIGIA
jgi:hypothetical protein